MKWQKLKKITQAKGINKVILKFSLKIIFKINFSKPFISRNYAKTSNVEILELEISVSNIYAVMQCLYQKP